MRRKLIKDLANTLCQMLAARIVEDLETLATLPDGTLWIDVLTGVASHQSAENISLVVSGELRDWLCHRLSVHGIPLQAISAANVTVDVRTDLIPTDRQRIISFDFTVRSLIRTDEIEYSGQSLHAHSWHTRGAL